MEQKNGRYESENKSTLIHGKECLEIIIGSIM